MNARNEFKAAWKFIRANRIAATAIIDKFWNSEDYVTEDAAYRSLGCASSMLWPAIRSVRMREHVAPSLAKRLEARTDRDVYNYN
ncbi:hypothetical protein ACUTR7_24965 [Delftia sp. NA_296.1]|uniref:hypothetical protein n=1 Tax=Delftia sp. NA_296.1 TaxID=3415648 RepID=UPI0040468141